MNDTSNLKHFNTYIRGDTAKLIYFKKVLGIESSDLKTNLKILIICRSYSNSLHATMLAIYGADLLGIIIYFFH